MFYRSVVRGNERFFFVLYGDKTAPDNWQIAAHYSGDSSWQNNLATACLATRSPDWVKFFAQISF